jgi:hypothetical protein
MTPPKIRLIGYLKMQKRQLHGGFLTLHLVILTRLTNNLLRGMLSFPHVVFPTHKGNRGIQKIVNHSQEVSANGLCPLKTSHFSPS